MPTRKTTMDRRRHHARRHVLDLRRMVSEAEDGSRLDAFVGAWVAQEIGKPLSKSAIRKLIMAGAVRVDGREMRRPGAAVQAGSRLAAWVDVGRLTDAAHNGAPPAPLAILYEDDDLIAVAKPAGLVMHATADPRRVDLFNAVRSSRSLSYLGLHHRLDVDTSGVVLFTKREAANRPLAEQFAGGEVVKTYHAIVTRPRTEVPDRWRVNNRLAPGGSGRNSRVREAADGVPATTEFRVLERLRDALLVEARPSTGRKHQIRAHLAGGGLPIVGDARYGGAVRAGRCDAPRVMLHALSLSLRHPATGARLTIVCPYPPGFAQMLACLRTAGLKTRVR